MKWEKKGLVWSTKSVPDWADNSALTPTPFCLSEDVVRVYCGFRDKAGASRIGYVDLDGQNPSRVIGTSPKPALDIGRPGCFDDNGVILGDVLRAGNEIRMYYVGFQKVEKAKFLAFSGLAISMDGGETFERFSEAPVLDRADGAITINAIHTVMQEDGGWRAWVARGADWEIRGGIPYPRYEIWEMHSPDGKRFIEPPSKRISAQGDEYRIGRPSVFRMADGQLGMFYTAGMIHSDRYDAGFARSADDQNWIRADDEIGLVTGGGTDFDSRHLCYPRLFKTAGKYWAVYNGNDMGVDGFGLAELVEW